MAVPKLRFKDSGGREFPEWEEKKLGDFTERIKRKAPENSIAPVMMIAAESGFIYQKDRYSRENAGKSLTNYTLLKQGEFSYNHGYSKLRNYGSVFMLKELEARVPFVYHSFKLLNGVGDFWGYYLNSGLLDRTLKKTISSTARMDGLLNIGYEVYMDIKVRVPSLPEQQKIADFLTAYDIMIDTQTKRVEAMKTRKKGLLQKIFSQELRFKDAEGREFPEWEEKKLGELGEIITGTTPSTTEKSYYDNGIYSFVTPGDMTNKNIIDITERNLSESGLRNGRIVPADSVLVVCIGATIGKCCYVNKICSCNQQINVIIPNANFNGYFILNFIRTLEKRMKLLAGNTATPILNKKSFSEIIGFFPFLPEQQRIADFLTAVDNQLEVEEKRLETMKTIKKGLLQQMFV